MDYKVLRLLIDDYRKLSAKDLQNKFEPVYNMYWNSVLAEKLGCSHALIRKYRNKSNPVKPSFENFVLLRSMLDEINRRSQSSRH